MLDGLSSDANPTIYSSFAKSHLILSDACPLGAENTALGAFFVKESGGVFVLGEDVLSEHDWKQTKTEILERFTNFFADSTVHPQTYTAAPWYFAAHFHCANSSISATSLHQTHCATFTASYSGAIFWHDHKHLDRAWSEEEPVVG
jgi:hypothetical protein